MKTEKHYNLLLGKTEECGAGKKGNTSEPRRVWIISHQTPGGYQEI